MQSSHVLRLIAVFIIERYQINYIERLHHGQHQCIHGFECYIFNFFYGLKNFVGPLTFI